MGGASTEIDAATTDIVLEAAHWEPASIARAVRRHKLPSEASKRFERGVDPAIAGVALQRCVDLLVEHGGATAAPGYTVVGDRPPSSVITLHAARAGALAGMPIAREVAVTRLIEVGCTVDGGDVLQVSPPTWRPDLTDPADLIEEIVRLEGYDKIPSVLPTPPPGRGLTAGADAAAGGVARAGRRRVHRGAQLPVRLAGRARRVRPAARRSAPAGRSAGQPAVRGRAGAAYVAAAGLARDAATQRGAWQPQPGAVRDGPGLSAAAGCTAAAAARSRAPAQRRRARRLGRRAARPAAPRRGGAER